MTTPDLDASRPMSAQETADAFTHGMVEALCDEVADLRAQIDRITIRSTAYEDAYRIAYAATYQSHTGHWDSTGQHGRGCPECIRAREARENCDAALRDGLARLIDLASNKE